jgi:hypothetical protein
LFDPFVVDGLVVGDVLAAELLAGAAGEFVGEDAGTGAEVAGASFLSPAVVGAFSPSDGGFSLSE